MTDHWHPGDEPPKCKDCRFHKLNHCLHPAWLTWSVEKMAFEAEAIGSIRPAVNGCGSKGRLFEALYPGRGDTP